MKELVLLPFPIWVPLAAQGILEPRPYIKIDSVRTQGRISIANVQS